MIYFSLKHFTENAFPYQQISALFPEGFEKRPEEVQGITLWIRSICCSGGAGVSSPLPPLIIWQYENPEEHQSRGTNQGIHPENSGKGNMLGNQSGRDHAKPHAEIDGGVKG